MHKIFSGYMTCLFKQVCWHWEENIEFTKHRFMSLEILINKAFSDSVKHRLVLDPLNIFAIELKACMNDDL